MGGEGVEEGDKGEEGMRKEIMKKGRGKEGRKAWKEGMKERNEEGKREEEKKWDGNQ